MSGNRDEVQVAIAYLFPEVIQEVESVSMEVSLIDGPLFGSSVSEKNVTSPISLATQIDNAALRDRVYSLIQKMAFMPVRSSLDTFLASILYRTDLNPEPKR